MRDYNFFEPYIKNNKKSEFNQKIFYVFFIFIFITAVVYPVWNKSRKYKYEQQIKQYSNLIQNLDVAEELESVNKQLETLENLKKLGNNEKTDLFLKQKDVLNEEVIEAFKGAIPVDLYFISVEISSKNIKIKGKTNARYRIADFEHLIKQSSAFKNIFISDIDTVNGRYEFTIQFDIKDVVIHD